MGLDAVELVMKLEDAFGIELRDEEVVDTVTPRMLGDVIFSKLQACDVKICQSQRAFYLLRKSFLKIFGLERKAITPDIEFRSLIPKEQEKDLWKQIKSDVAARSWPEMSRPLWMLRFFAAIDIAIFLGIIFSLVYFTRDFRIIFGGSIILGLLCIAVFDAISKYLTISYVRYIPYEYTYLKDLIPYVITSDHIKWTREQVSERLKTVIMDQLVLDESEYSEDANFVEDFHLD